MAGNGLASVADVVVRPCICQGHNPGCAICQGEGVVQRPACKRCVGKGTTGGSAKCMDCRGEGWRDVDLL